MRFYKAVAICSLYALIIDNKARSLVDGSDKEVFRYCVDL